MNQINSRVDRIRKMYTLLAVATIGLSLAAVGCRYRQTTEDSGSAVISNTATFQPLIDGMWNALKAQDEALFRQYCTPDWNIYTARARRLDIQALFDLHRKNIKDFDITLSNIRCREFRDVAWITYDAQMSAFSQGKPWGGQFIMTMILEKQNSQWKVAHLHESRQLDN